MNQASVGTIRKLAFVATALLLFLLLIPAFAFAADQPSYTVKVDQGYLALRSAPAYDSNNEIGELYTGDVVRVIDSTSNSEYWKVQTSKYRDSGWVNKDYLVYLDDSYDGDYTVTVDKNYLALRSAPAYEQSNEIGKLYSGDTVSLVNTGNGQYWWVYSPKYDECGYVDKNFLASSIPTYGDYRVKVDTGYLALRSAPAYDSDNEIGKLNTGDTVNVQEKRGQYWWVYSPKYDKEGYVNSDYLVKR